MKENRVIPLSRRETLWGFGYLGFELLLLPVLLTQINGRAARPMAEADLNFLYFSINYLAVFLIFNRVLYVSSQRIWSRKLRFLGVSLAGIGLYLLWSLGFEFLAGRLLPGFRNANDQNITALLRGNFSLMLLGTVLLVPMAEECLFRGLIFGRIYPVSRGAAYGVSAVVFSLIHILGYLGTAPLTDLAAAFIQYLPAGLILAGCYAATGTLFCPVLIHAVINAVGIVLLVLR